MDVDTRAWIDRSMLLPAVDHGRHVTTSNPGVDRRFGSLAQIRIESADPLADFDQLYTVYRSLESAAV